MNDEIIGEAGFVTTDINGEATSRPTTKVVAATGGSAIGVAVTTVGVWIIEATASIDIPGPVELAIGLIVTGIITYAAGWLAKPGSVG